MAIHKPFRAGDKLSVANPNALSLYKSAEVKGIGEAGGERFVWLLTVSASGAERLLTFADETVRGYWKLVPDFFVKGKTYKYSNRLSAVRFEIKDVHEVDNPVDPRDSPAAVAEGTNAFGQKWITVLHEDSFKIMVEDLGKW